MLFTPLSISLVAGLLAVVIYVLIALFKAKKPELGEAAVIFLAFPGIVAGGSIFLKCISPGTLPFTEEERVYFAFSGIVMIWLALTSVCESYAKALSKKTS